MLQPSMFDLVLKINGIEKDLDAVTGTAIHSRYTLGANQSCFVRVIAGRWPGVRSAFG